MGIQEVLLVILSIIITATVIVVGLTMYRSQSYILNQNALQSESAKFAAKVVDWHKAPEDKGGAGSSGTISSPADSIGISIGFEGASTTTEAGTYTITKTDNSVVITALGKKINHKTKPKVVSTVNFPSGKIRTATTSEKVAP